MSGFRGLKGLRTLVTGAASGIGRATVPAPRRGGRHRRHPRSRRRGRASARPRCCATIGRPGPRLRRGHRRRRRGRRAPSPPSSRELGPIDALVNNAGWDLAGSFAESDPTSWRKVVDINLYGPLNVTRAVLPGHDRGGPRADREHRLRRGARRLLRRGGLRRLQGRHHRLLEVGGARDRARRASRST